jgi:lipopolysaccharide transport system ATP-binding protein
MEQSQIGPKGEGEGATESKGAAGVRLAGQAGAAFPNPSTSELARDSENASLIRSANAPHSSEEQSDSKALDSRPSTLVSAPKAQAPSDWVYALKDVSFEVKRGEVLGIIGRNGAGKSTLLKILSRVTTQSSGQIKVKGRIASLLEVGTGFHPELTGRENIFLNGAILGMRKAEIARKFDEIVEFSGCARYIDTPVKRYSSGMYVRLAFAVAAHLEPEILIVDEVLAVGDAEFQKKCLGKMKDVAGHGRTILFVSHNLHAVSRLCTKGCYFKNGMLVDCGDISSVLQNYERSVALETRKITGHSLFETNKFAIISLDSRNPASGNEIANTGEPYSFEIDWHSKADSNILSVGIVVYHSTGAKLLNLDSLRSGDNIRIPKSRSRKIVFDIESLPLLTGEYTISVWVHEEGMGSGHELENVRNLEVIEKGHPSHEIKPLDDGAVYCQFGTKVI